MKRINIIIALGLMTLGMASCQDRNWDKEINTAYEIGNQNIVEETAHHITVKDLKEKYKNAILGIGKYSKSPVQLVEEDLQLRVRVVTNDEGGNLSQQIVVTDESNENIVISIADNDIMTYLRVGQELLVNLKDLYVGGYNDVPQIGYPDEKFGSSDFCRVSFMNRYIWYKHFKKIGQPDQSLVPAPVELTKSFDSWTDCSRLVYVDGKFSSRSGDVKIAEPSRVQDTDTGNGVNEDFITDNGVKVQLRTSTYCDFASYLIPAAKCRIYGIASWSTYDGGYWQFSLRTQDDITIHCDQCNKWLGLTNWTKTEEGDYRCNKCGSIVKKLTN